jgi:anti-sigma B factor antagonist
MPTASTKKQGSLMCLIITAQHGKYTVICMTEKRLDAQIALSFRENIKKLADEGHRFIIFDLTSVQFIDSSGLGAIVASLKLLGNQGNLILCGANENVSRLFMLTHMNKVFSIYMTLDEALAIET